ncbi:MAG: 50S ribosomal protein L11 methyltransferase [Holophagae bacterium]
MSRYLGLRCEIPSSLEDEFGGLIASWPVLGAEVETGDDERIVAVVYFEQGELETVSHLTPILEDWGALSVKRLVVEEKDWLAAYRESARPFVVGSRWWIDPRPDSIEPQAAGRMRLVVEPRAAFGSGSHESTQLVLLALEGMELRGRRVLDAGTGSSILALAADRLGAGMVLALDTDATAVWVARQTLGQQDWRPRIHLLAGPVDALAGGGFDLVLCNMVSSSFLPLVPHLAKLLTDGGRAVFSGILELEKESVGLELDRAGFAAIDELRLGEWLALVVGLGK